MTRHNRRGLEFKSGIRLKKTRETKTGDLGLYNNMNIYKAPVSIKK